MERHEKVGERGNKKEEFLGIKLKRGILVGKRGVQSTPSPTWRLGLAETGASSFQDFTFPSNFTRTISARKLAANLWEVEPNVELVKMSKGGPLQQHHKHKDKGFELPNLTDEPPDCSDDQPPTGSNLRKHVAEPSIHRQSVERKCDAFLPVSPRSCSSMEMMAPSRPAITPSGFKGRFKESRYDLKTSTELLKVLNRIWSLEEQHISNISLMKAMQKELNHARVQIKTLLKEKKRDCQEMDDLMKQLAKTNDARRNEGQDQIQEAIQSVRNELEDERKLRKHSESLHRKLARELSEVKSSFSNTLKELEREKKAWILLEDLCDEFAKGIIDCEQEIRFLKHKSELDFSVREHTDRLIVHISEAWLDARMQMKLAEANSGHDKKTILDKLSLEIETFLQAKQSGSFGNDGVSSFEKPIGSTLQRSSLESFHLNEAGSAPKNGNDEEDSLDSGLYSSKVHRDPSRQHRDGSINQNVQVVANKDSRRIIKSNRLKKRILSRVVRKDSDLSSLQAQFKENMLIDFSCNRCKGEPVDGTQELTRIGDQVQLNASENIMDEVMQDHSLGKKNKEMGSQNELLDKLKCCHSFSSEGMEHQYKNKNAANSFGQSSFVGPASQVERWTSKAIYQDPPAPESSLRWPQGTQDNTLKAKLLEARLESQQSRSSASRGL